MREKEKVKLNHRLYVMITVPFDLRKPPEAKRSCLPTQLILDTSGLTAGGF